MKISQWIAIGLSMMSSSAFAAQSEYTCTSSTFPQNRGSTLKLSFSGNHPTEAELYLNDGGNGTFPSSMAYNVSTANNEDGTPVIYLNWSGGAGVDSENPNLMPKTMVIYAFQANYDEDHSLFLGTIEWAPNGDKIETHYNFQCTPVVPAERPGCWKTRLGC